MDNTRLSAYLESLTPVQLRDLAAAIQQQIRDEDETQQGATHVVAIRADAQPHRIHAASP